jgi:hypothetical protein
MEDNQKEIILRKINLPASRESLLDLINWLDNECIATKDSSSLPYQILARSIVALGYKLLNNLGNIETILNTIKAGETYALNPSEQNWDMFCEWATMSYPFGPGDGCFCIKELGDSCKPGSGCISGSGSLASQELDDAEVMASIAQELIPWVLGSDDPVISRP